MATVEKKLEHLQGMMKGLEARNAAAAAAKKSASESSASSDDDEPFASMSQLVASVRKMVAEVTVIPADTLSDIMDDVEFWSPEVRIAVSDRESYRGARNRGGSVRGSRANSGGMSYFSARTRLS